MKGVCRMSFPPTNLVLRTIKLLPEQAHRVAHLECFWHILNTFLMFSLKLWKLLTIMAYFIRWNHYYYTTGPFPLLESYLIYRSVMVVMRGERSNIKSVCAFLQGSVLEPVLYTLFTSDLPCLNVPGTLWQNTKRQESHRNFRTRKVAK